MRAGRVQHRASLRTSRAVGVTLVLAGLVATACGSRANQAQIAEALRSAGGAGSGAAQTGGVTAGAGGSAGGAGSGSTAQGLTVGAGNSTSAGNGVAGASGSGASTSGNSSSQGSPAASSGCGGGGATDVGVSPTTLTAANVSVLTGPVPGLFAGALNGTDAFFQYQNSLGGVCGRKLSVIGSDDQFDCGTNKAVTEEDMTKAFAFVGSFSLFDDCGAQAIDTNRNLADVHAALAQGAQAEPNNFSPAPIRAGMPTGPILWAKSMAGNAITHAGSLVGDVQSAKDAWVGEQQAMEAFGYRFAEVLQTEPTETDFTSEIVRLKAAGVQFLVLIAEDVKSIARIENAAEQQNFHPVLTLLGASAYDPTLDSYATNNGAIEGVYIYQGAAMYLGQDSTNPEVQLFLQWLHRTHPQATPDLFTAYGWASARLFVQALQAIHGPPTRPALLAALRQVHRFDSNGLLAPADPVNKIPEICWLMIKVHSGHFTRDTPASGFRCDGTFWYAPNGKP